MKHFNIAERFMLLKTKKEASLKIRLASF